MTPMLSRAISLPPKNPARKRRMVSTAIVIARYFTIFEIP